MEQVIVALLLLWMEERRSGAGLPCLVKGFSSGVGARLCQGGLWRSNPASDSVASLI